MVKKIAILGSTGSIGKNALKVIGALNSTASSCLYEIFALTANSSVEQLAEQIRQNKPKYAAITDQKYYQQLKELVSDLDVELLAGARSLVEIAESEDVDIVLNAIVGAAGLEAVLAAAMKGKRLAIANKEPLVIAGRLLTEAAAENGAEILPIDSEHSAVFQAMQAGKIEEVSKIILTTSGGPFRNFSPADLEKVTLEQALAHPVWDMGPKITIDSATMMNKALEIIEAHSLFGIATEKIEVLVHPESIIHSLVEFIDGSIIAQLGLPDMCLPIQYALTYPERVAGIAKRLSLEQIGRLTFERPNTKTFRVLDLAYEVAKAGGIAPAVFNAANESAVEHFLAGRISFVKITELIEDCVQSHELIEEPTLEELLEADRRTREKVNEAIQNKVKNN